MEQSSPIFRPFSKNILAKLEQEPQQLKTVDQRSFLKQVAAWLSPAWLPSLAATLALKK
jgi:hypothetical protein